MLRKNCYIQKSWEYYDVLSYEGNNNANAIRLYLPKNGRFDGILTITSGYWDYKVHGSVEFEFNVYSSASGYFSVVCKSYTGVDILPYGLYISPEHDFIDIINLTNKRLSTKVKFTANIITDTYKSILDFSFKLVDQNINGTLKEGYLKFEIGDHFDRPNASYVFNKTNMFDKYPLVRNINLNGLDIDKLEIRSNVHIAPDANGWVYFNPPFTNKCLGITITDSGTASYITQTLLTHDVIDRKKFRVGSEYKPINKDVISYIAIGY